MYLSQGSRAPRRGRSQTAYIFGTQAAGPPIHSRTPYGFLDHLEQENLRVMVLEHTDWVYRGDLRPDDDSDSSDSESDVELPTAPRPLRRHTVLNPGRDSSPEGYTDRDSSPESPSHVPSPSSSPPPLEAVLNAASSNTGPVFSNFDADDITMSSNAGDDIMDSRPRSLSPTVTELFGERSISPTVSDFLSDVLTDISSPPPSTHFAREQEQQELDAARARARFAREQQQHTLDAAHHARVAEVLTPRRSRRLRSGRAGDSTEGAVWTIADLRDLEIQVLTDVIDTPRPLVDAQMYVIGVIAPGPKGAISEWSLLIASAHREMLRVYRNGDFSHCGEGESVLRVGLDYGLNGPLIIKNSGANRREVYQLVRSDSFQAISAYQNHSYRQFGPSLFAHQMSKLDSLKDRNIHPPFKHSVFSTAEWCFGDAASPPRKHKYDLFYTFCAITAIGEHAPSRGQVILWKDGNALPFIPGTTILFPAGCQSYSFAAVNHQETRFYFKQYFNAALVRWVDKGRRSDTQFGDYASQDEMHRMSAARVNRGEYASTLYSKLQDLFVV